MFLALVRRILLFVSFLFLVTFALIFIHALREGGEFSWTTGLGAGTAAVALGLSWIGMVKTDDYLTPAHTRIFFFITAVITGLAGFGLFGYFIFSDAHPSSSLHFFGMAPAGVAVVFIILAVTRMKEAYNLPAEYRPDATGSLAAILQVTVSLLTLLVAAGSLGLTLKALEFHSRFDASLPEQPAPLDSPDDAARRTQAEETFQLALEQQAQNRYRGAYELFHQAARRGHVEAEYELALIYSGDGYLRDLTKAQKHLKNAAAKDHLEATFRLGKAYRHGELGLEQDYGKAKEYLEIAAAAGHLEAQTQLGHLYNSGNGVPVDHEKAFHWFLKAAEQGDAIAQNDVGIFYLQGKGVEMDAEKGFHWLTLAADQGVAVAEYNVGRALYSGEMIEQDYERAFTYFKSLAEKKIPYGFQMIGLQYLHGRGPAKDEEAAFKAFAEGAARRDPVSEFYLGYCYLHGLGTGKNPAAALNYLSTAAAQDHAEAQLLLGRIYLEGAIILQDRTEAAKWFELAAANGSEEAATEREALQQALSEAELADATERVAIFRQKNES